MNLPKARTIDIVDQELDGELLIYNLTTHKAYTLNETSKIVFEACSRKLSFEELKNRHKLTEDLIYLALDSLKSNDLLEENADYVSPFNGMNRRDVIRKIGLASMVALPVVSSLISPPAANAASGQRTLGQSCSFSPGNGPQGNCATSNLYCFNSTCQEATVVCGCVSPGDCIVQTVCPSTVNCNPMKICAP